MNKLQNLNISYNRVVDISPLSKLNNLSILFINNNPILYCNLSNLECLSNLNHLVTNLHEIKECESNFIFNTIKSIKLLNGKENKNEKRIVIDFDKNNTYIDGSTIESKEKSNIKSKLESNKVESPSLKDSSLDIPYVLESKIDDCDYDDYNELEDDKNEKTPKRDVESIYIYIYC